MYQVGICGAVAKLPRAPAARQMATNPTKAAACRGVDLTGLGLILTEYVGKLEVTFPVRTKSTRYQLFGSIPIRSFTADRMRCLQPRYRSVVWIET